MTRPLLLLALAASMAACSAAPQAEPAPPLADARYAPPSVVYPEYPEEPLAGGPPAVAPRVAPPTLAPQRMAAGCDIRVRPTREGIEVKAIASANRSMVGEYALTITKSGASGSSDTEQSGPFSARAGEDVPLSATEISLGRRDRYRAVLTLTEGRSEICRREVRS